MTRPAFLFRGKGFTVWGLVVRTGVLLWPALCVFATGCDALCEVNCAESYSDCVGGSTDPLLEQHCQWSYDSCMESCTTADGSGDCEADAGWPSDVSSAGIERN